MRARWLLVLIVLTAALPSPAQAQEDAVGRALDHLAARGIQDASEAPYYVEAAAQAGLDPKRWPSPEAPAFSALAPYAQDDETTAYNSNLRIAYAAATAGYDPREVNGVDYVDRVRAGFRGAQFGNPATFNDDAWAILALRAAGVPASDDQIRAAVTVLRSAQRLDGGWSFNAGALASDTDVTGAVLAALRSANADMREFGAKAGAFLDSTRVAGGGHSAVAGSTTPTTQSTVWAIHGYAALGRGPSAGALEFIRDRQRADGGFQHIKDIPSSNVLATTEAIPALVGARHPFAGYAAPEVGIPPTHAREPIAIEVRAPFTRVAVTWDDGREGRVAFDRAGSYHYRYLAEGPGVRARGEGDVRILSARPVIGSFPANVSTFRHANLTLDLRNATDPDGTIATFEVDWGDGNWTNGAERSLSHAYALPGECALTIRARDDAGVWSRPASVRVSVVNRAPRLPELPPRVIADRVAGVALDLAATDPEGDAIVLSWSFGDSRGAGSPRFVPKALGDHRLVVAAQDAFGAQTSAQTIVRVVNVPPTLALDLPASAKPIDEIALLANATDADGPPPTIAWTIDGDAVEGQQVRLAPGAHAIRATATDADGATANATATIHVEEAPEQRTRVAPEVRDLRAELAEGTLRLSFELRPPNATARVAWRSDGGEGEADATSPFVVALAGATWASASVTATHDGLASNAQTELLLAPYEAPAPRAATPTAAAVVVESTASPAPAVVPAAPRSDEPLEHTALIQQPARHETPAAGVLLSLLVAALLATRGRRAAWARRSRRRARR